MANPFERDKGKGRMSDDEVARLSEQFADLTSAQLPLASGLRATADEMSRGRLWSSLRSVADDLDRGASVDEALAARGGRLPGHLRGLVAIGSKTGKIGEVLGRFVAYNHVGADLRRQLWIGMAYPILALSIAFGIFAYICTALIPSFENIFKDFGISLPPITIAVLNVSHLFAVSWWMLAEVVIGLLAIWVLAFVLLSGPTRRALLAGVPVVGVVWRNTSLAEFCHLLALLLESEVPLGEALRLTGKGVRDASIDAACVAAAHDVDGGLGFGQALARQPIFPKGLGRVLRWAEGHQSLPESLRMAGEMFEAGARVQAGFAGTVVAVFVVLSIMTAVVMLVLGLFLPLITLITRLSG